MAIIDDNLEVLIWNSDNTTFNGWMTFMNWDYCGFNRHKREAYGEWMDVDMETRLSINWDGVTMMNDDFYDWYAMDGMEYDGMGYWSMNEEWRFMRVDGESAMMTY